MSNASEMKERYQTDEVYRNMILTRNKVWRKQYVDSLRLQVLTKYGHTCSCCRESRREFLAIEHVNGGGNLHRKQLQSQRAVYKAVLDADTSLNEFTLLCHNCNQARGYYGYCPHEKERAENEQAAPPSTDICL